MFFTSLFLFSLFFFVGSLLLSLSVHEFQYDLLLLQSLLRSFSNGTWEEEGHQREPDSSSGWGQESKTVATSNIPHLYTQTPSPPVDTTTGSMSMFNHGKKCFGENFGFPFFHNNFSKFLYMKIAKK